jgi:hypothetical protein
VGLGSISAAVLTPEGSGWLWLLGCRFMSGLGVSLFISGGSM